MWRSLRLFPKTRRFSVNLGETADEESFLHPFSRLGQLDPPFAGLHTGAQDGAGFGAVGSVGGEAGPEAAAGEGSLGRPVLSPP